MAAAACGGIAMLGLMAGLLPGGISALASLPSIGSTGAIRRAADIIPETYGTVPLAKAWQFHDGDIPEASGASFDDSAWQSVDIPYGQADGATDGKDADDTNDSAPHVRWYRRRVEIPAGDRRYRLRADELPHATRLYVNGQEVQMPDADAAGHTLVDVTGNILRGQMNVIAMRIDEDDDAMATLGNVSLIVSGDVSLDDDSMTVSDDMDATHGKGTSMTVRQTVMNDSQNDVTIRYKVSLFDASGRLVAETAIEKSVPSNGRTDVEATLGALMPSLWSPDSPYLYKVVTELEDEGETLGATDAEYGFRWFEWDGGKALFRQWSSDERAWRLRRDGLHGSREHPGKRYGGTSDQDDGHGRQRPPA